METARSIRRSTPSGNGLPLSCKHTYFIVPLASPVRRLPLPASTFGSPLRFLPNSSGFSPLGLTTVPLNGVRLDLLEYLGLMVNLPKLSHYLFA